jgi:hypothetical protein
MEASSRGEDKLRSLKRSLILHIPPPQPFQNRIHMGINRIGKEFFLRIGISRHTLGFSGQFLDGILRNRLFHLPGPCNHGLKRFVFGKLIPGGCYEILDCGNIFLAFRGLSCRMKKGFSAAIAAMSREGMVVLGEMLKPHKGAFFPVMAYPIRSEPADSKEPPRHLQMNFL